MTLLVLREDSTLDTDQEILIGNLKELRTSGHVRNSCNPNPKGMPTPVIVVGRPYEQVDYIKPGLFLVSARMKKLLEEYNVACEFVQCKVVSEDGTSAESVYYYCNVLDLVDCFDFEKSKYSKGKHIGGIDLLVLNENTAEGHHLFLVGPMLEKNADNSNKIAEVIYCVSEVLAAEIVRRGFTNFSFCEPKYWRDYPTNAVEWTPRSS